MTRPKPDADFVAQQAKRMIALLRERAALPPDDLAYVVERVASLKDERLKACIAELIGWGDDERAEVETFVAISIEVLARTTTSRIREAATTVHLRSLMREMK